MHTINENVLCTHIVIHIVEMLLIFRLFVHFGKLELIIFSQFNHNSIYKQITHCVILDFFKILSGFLLSLP